MARGPIGEQCRRASAAPACGRYGRVPVPPVPLVPEAPVPVPVPLVPVPVVEPGRPRDAVSLIAPVPEPDRPREAVSLIVPVPVAPVPVVPVPLVPAAPVPDIEPEAPIPVSVPLVPAAPVPDVPTSPPLVPAVLSRLLPLLQAPTVSTAASASMLLPVVILRMTPLSPCCPVMNVAAVPAGGHPIRDGATRNGGGRKRGANEEGRKHGCTLYRVRPQYRDWPTDPTNAWTPLDRKRSDRDLPVERRRCLRGAFALPRNVSGTRHTALQRRQVQSTAVPSISA
jgi:hypothetical protein